MEARVTNHSHSVHRTAASALSPGTVVQELGLGGVILGSGPIAANEVYEVGLDVVADVASASATTFSEGDDVQWDDTAKLAVASGDFSLGKANIAKVNGETTVSVAFNKGVPLATVARSGITQENLKSYELSAFDARTTGTGQPLGASAGTPSGAFGLTAGTHGTAPPVIVGEAASGNSKTDACRYLFTLPPEYVAGETATLRVRAIETVGAATVETTIDAQVYSNDDDGTVTGDLVTTAAIDVTDTVGDKDFTINPATLVPGMQLDIELTGVTNDTGGSVGTVLALYRVELLLDIKG